MENLVRGKRDCIYIEKILFGVLCGEWILETQNGSTGTSLEVTVTVKAGKNNGLERVVETLMIFWRSRGQDWMWGQGRENWRVTPCTVMSPHLLRSSLKSFSNIFYFSSFPHLQFLHTSCRIIIYKCIYLVAGIWFLKWNQYYFPIPLFFFILLLLLLTRNFSVMWKEAARVRALFFWYEN